MVEISADTQFVGFLGAMKAWESDNFTKLSNALDNDDFKLAKVVKEKSKSELEAIFETYCVPGRGDRRRLISTSMKFPVTYDPERDKWMKVLTENTRVVYEYQQCGGLETKIRFTLKMHENVWKIYKAEFFSKVDSSWLVWTI